MTFKQTKLEAAIESVSCTLVDDAVDFFGIEDRDKLVEWSTSVAAIEGAITSYCNGVGKPDGIKGLTIEAVRQNVLRSIA